MNYYCSLPTLLTEGMETPEFWSLLGGKAEYSHHSIKNEVRHQQSVVIWNINNIHLIDSRLLYKFHLLVQ